MCSILLFPGLLLFVLFVFGFSILFYVSLEISRDAMVEAMEQNQRPRSRSSTAPAIIAETDGGVTIQFSSENLPITASIPINVNNTPKDLGTTESTIDSVDTEVEEIMNGSIQTLEVMFDVDGVDGCPPTGEVGGEVGGEVYLHEQ